MQGSEQTSDTPTPPVQIAGLSAPWPPDRPGPRRPVELRPWLPCTLALNIPVANFTVGSLLALTKGSLVETACHQSTDIPHRVNGLLMAWTEFKVVGGQPAARITDMV